MSPWRCNSRTLSSSLRPLGVADRVFVRDLSRRVFSHFGDYDQVLPEWLDGPGVWGFVALESGAAVGFTMLSLTGLPQGAGYLIPEGARPAATPLALDLMAIAVQPEHQRAGAGRRLLESAIQEAEHLVATDVWVLAVSLLVGEENQPARRLFEKLRFQPLPGRESYPNGQKAVRMVRPVVGWSA